jgi:hypothetical protein
MADLTAACILKHRQLLQCRRATLGKDIADKISIGTSVDCLERKMKLVDGILNTICNYDADATENCLDNDQICKLINYTYKLLPKDC